MSLHVTEFAKFREIHSAMRALSSRTVKIPVSFPVKKDPGGADGAPQGVDEEGPIRLPHQGEYKSGFPLF